MTYIHILVVRKEEFVDYMKIWELSHVIIHLPDTMKHCEMDVAQGGIGFARLFVTMLFHELGLNVR